MTDAQTPAPAPMLPPTDDGPKGIGGWLVLPIVGLFLTVAWTLVTLAPVLHPDNIAGYQAFFDGRVPAEYNAMMYVALVSGANGVIGIGLAAACLIQIFRTSRSVPVLMTVFYVFGVWAIAIEWYALSEFPLLRESDNEIVTAGTQTVGSIMRAALWISYFWLSKRVKNTFVN